MKPRGNDPMRPSTPPPLTSWWTDAAVQHDRAAFDATAAKEAARMNAVQTTQHIQRKDGDR